MPLGINFMKKEIIFIGLGRMGTAMTANLVEKGFIVYGFDSNDKAREEATKSGVTVFDSLHEVMKQMSTHKIVWLMVPSKFVDDVLDEISAELKSGDIVIDGGNSFFKDTIQRKKKMAEKEIHYIDCGTSGGVDGARHGASIMVGGDEKIISNISDIFIALATTNGYARVGESGAGHFVKMIHNGIEYGMMGAIAEGLSLVESYRENLNIDIKEVLNPYENGSIISSRLVSWIAKAYKTEGYLENIVGEVPRGETEFEIEFIIDQKQTPVLEAALAQRQSTRKNPSRTGVLISAMRNQFGGHKTINKTER
jgi:6-phosphogluconate dehydrogenase